MFQTEGTVRAKVLRWCVQGTARKPMWLEWRDEGPLYKASGDSLRIWAFSLRERKPRKGFQ